MKERRSKARIASAVRVAFCLVCATLSAGCVSMLPLEEVRRELSSADSLLELPAGDVHVERAGDKGSPVLLIHGFGSSTWAWRLIQPALANEHRTLAIDLWGFGLSDRPTATEHYTRGGQVELVLDVMAELGYEQAHIVAHSYGGAIAMALAHDHPEKVLSLTLLASAPPEYPIERRKLFAAFKPAVFTYLRGIGLRESNVRRVLGKMYYDPSILDQELIDAYRERLRIEGATDAYYRMTRPLARERHQPRIRYDELEPPMLVIWGENDAVVSVDDGRSAAGQIERARFEVIEQCGHVPMEEKPERVLALLLPYLEEIESQPQLP